MGRKKKQVKFTSILKHFLWLKFEETWAFWLFVIIPLIIGHLLPWPVSPFFNTELEGYSLIFVIGFESWLKGMVITFVLLTIFLLLVWLKSNWREAKELAEDEL